MTPVPDSASETRPGTAPPLTSDVSGKTLPLQPGAAFGTRYRILRVLGCGGMGVVYQAWDDALGVAVALKVIRPEVLQDPYAAQDVERRFKRELLLARQVTHKNVVRIHDLGEIDGIKYLTMPYVEGRDLASALRGGPLPAARALRIARQIADGLQAAHDAGVVHRDLKPENVMLDADDGALIMDFGISRSLGSGATMTAQGVIVGTLEYMAPEQGRGMPADFRSDIYAFGLIVYDMIAGRQRLQSDEGAIAEMMSRMMQAPASLQAIVTTVPQSLSDLVGTCIQPEPEHRFQTTAALVAALAALDREGRAPVRRRLRRTTASRMVIGAGAIVLVLASGAVGGGWWFRSHAPTVAVTAAAAPLSLLIADFKNDTGDSVFEGSVEQALGIAMEGASFISTYSRNDARRTLAAVAGTQALDEAGARIVAMREGIGVVLAGSIVNSGTGYTVLVRAIDPRTDTTIATSTVGAGRKGTVLQAISTVASAMRSRLGDTASGASRAADAETFTAGSIEAMRAYARGQELNAAGKPREALTAFEEAVRLDPGFGRAYVNMASIYTNLKLDDRAKALYEDALKHLDRMTAREKYRTRGVYYLGIHDYEQAIENFERLVKDYPADNMGYANLALAYVYVRNIKNAVDVGKRATEINPGNVLQRTNYATYSLYAGDFDTAVQQARIVLKQNGGYEFAHLTLALSTLAKGDVPGARAAYARLAAVSPLGRSLATMGIADLEMYLGRDRQALEVLVAGAAADATERSWSNLALKEVAIAEAQLTIGRLKEAAAAARSALGHSQHESVQFPAGRVLIAAGHPDSALALAGHMEDALEVQTRSYGRLLKAAVSLHNRRYADAVDGIREALKMHDSWAGHLLLAEAFTAAGQSAQAEEEWDRCLARRGEAADAFFADTSSLRYLAPVYYYLGRAREAVGAAEGAKHNYRDFLKLREQADPPDPLATDARQRIGQH
jgi:tetratricopeptide (TPR) repeat protein/tRNA A-37 threonylcarbamoyl transferase component Bud32